MSLKYFAVKIAEAGFSIWGVVTGIFFIVRLAGDPAVLMLPIGASEADLNAFRHTMGLDQPLYSQYLHFLGSVAKGDFGESYLHGKSALIVVLERMPATIELALTAILLGVILGGSTGLIAARKQGSGFELVAMVVALIGQATPVFWLGIMLILFFSVQLGWFPSGGRGTLAHLVLPAVTLATFCSASIARLFRSSMIEIMKEDYIRTAWAKGLPSRVVIFTHAARNGLIPVVTMLGLLVGTLLGGSVVTETVFSWPGVGRLIVQAIGKNDFPVVQAGVTVIAVTFVGVNLLVDLVYGILDPRIRLGG
jgi:peptide/nickel transport system permease protein